MQRPNKERGKGAEYFICYFFKQLGIYFIRSWAFISLEQLQCFKYFISSDIKLRESMTWLFITTEVVMNEGYIMGRINIKYRGEII